MDKFIKKRNNSDDCDPEHERLSKVTKPCTSKMVQARPNRQYCDTYLKFGFTWAGNDDHPFSLCLVCGEKMFNEAMLPSKLKRLFTIKHQYLQRKDSNYFKRLSEQQSKQGVNFQKKFIISEKAQIASLR